MRILILVVLLSACGSEPVPPPDEITIEPVEAAPERLECEGPDDVGQTVPIEPEPGIEPCNGTTPFCQRFMCYRCEETQPSFFDWVARPECDS